MREFLGEIDYTEVEKEVSPRYEIPVIAKNTEKTLLFNNVKGSSYRVAINLASTRKKIADALGCNIKDIPFRLKKAMESPKDTKVVGELDSKKPDLSKLPVLKHYPNDRGKYITSGVVVTKDKEGRRNASIHRLLVKDRKRLGIRIVKRHLHKIYTKYEENNEALDIAIVIGLDPVSLLGTCTRVPFGYDEFELISSLKNKNLELVKCDTVDIEVPKGEIILEGKILPKLREKEGPFVDITGTYDVVRKEPVVELTGMNLREDAIYQGLLPAGDEHKHIMGLPYEPLIIKEVNKVCDVKNAVLTNGSSCYLHGIVQINKKNSKDGEKAIESAIKAHSSMKHCLVIDDDIDIYDRDDLEYAISTRVKGDEDIYVYPNTQGSTLDPRGESDGAVTKTGVDATKVLGKEDRFERAKIPHEEEIELSDYLEG